MVAYSNSQIRKKVQQEAVKEKEYIEEETSTNEESVGKTLSN